MLSIILDVAVVLIFLISFLIGLRRGFIRSVMGLAAVIVAFVVAWNFSPLLVDTVNQKYVYDYTEKKVMEKLEKDQDENGKLKIDEIFDNLPDSVKEIFERCGVNSENTDECYGNAESNAKTNSIEAVAEFIARPISKMISKTIAFTALFVVTFVVVIIILVILDKMSKLPGVNIINNSLGALMGVIKGLLIAIVVSMVLYHILPIVSEFYSEIPENTIDKTVIVQYLGSLKFLALL